jgi:hypothetical protein
MLQVGAAGIEEEEEEEEEEELLVQHSVICEFSVYSLVYIRMQKMCQKRNKNSIQ